MAPLKGKDRAIGEKQWQDARKRLCRYLDGRSEEDLAFFCVHGYLPEVPIPGRPVDTSAWQEWSWEDHKRTFAGRSVAELEFFCVYGSWPKRAKGGAMVTLRNRLERLEKAQRFRYWLRHQRFLESLTDEQLEFYVVTRCPPDVPEPLPAESRLDKLDKRTLAKMWKEDERQFGGRGNEQLGFFADHGHWPEQACNQRNCLKVEFDELRAKFSTKAHQVALENGQAGQETGFG